MIFPYPSLGRAQAEICRSVQVRRTSRTSRTARVMSEILGTLLLSGDITCSFNTNVASVTER